MGIPRSRKPTLADVARRAGVSLKTASRALNNDAAINKETAAHVRGVMQELAYEPNELARGLKARKSAAVGMIVPNLADPFTASVVKAVQMVAKQHGHVVILAASDGDPVTEGVELRSLVRRQVDGLVVVPADHLQRELRSVIPQDLPVVCLDQPARDKSIDSILVTNQKGAQQAAAHLLDHGFTRILAIGARPYLYTCAQRVAGYLKAMRLAGRVPETLLVEHESALTPERLREALGPWMATGPFALLTLNWVMTAQVLHHLPVLGVRLGEGCALISFDDFDLAEVLTPPLSVVRQPAHELGTVAAEQLFSRILGLGGPSGPRKIVLPTEFILRESCGCKHAAVGRSSS